MRISLNSDHFINIFRQTNSTVRRKGLPSINGIAIAIYAMCMSMGGNAYAQKDSYPVKPIRFVVPFPAGGSADIVARELATKMSEGLGQQVVADNRGGAGGVIGEEITAHSAPDGYTMLMTTISHAVNPGLYKKLPYDTEKDFTAVAPMVSIANILVVQPQVPAKSVTELIALAKSKPGELNYGSGGNGTSLHLAGELFNSLAGVKIVRVMYKGGAPAITDLLGNHIQLMYAVIPTVMPLVKTGRLRALGVTSARRMPTEPDIPAIGEFVKGYEFVGWQGMLVPAHTPQPIIMKLNQEINRVLRLPDIQKRFIADGYEITPGTPQDFAALLKSETAKWPKVLKDAGIQAE